MSTLGVKTGSAASVSVVFTAHCPPFNAGEEAGLDPDTAERLAKQGRVRIKEPSALPVAVDGQGEGAPSALTLANAAVVDGQFVERKPPEDAAAPIEDHEITDDGKLKRKKK
jgi:hypothetical protein